MVSYNIITLNRSDSLHDPRQIYKDRIRKTVQESEEIFVPAINGREVNLEEELDRRNLFVKYPGAFSVGEIGIWLSMFDCWQWCIDNDETLITFEDDASPRHYFDEAVRFFLEEVPQDWDFMALWVPDNQKQDYRYNVKFDDEGHATIRGYAQESLFDFGAFYLARAYQGYGNVCSMFSPKGSQFLIDKARETGIYTPVDCFMFQNAHAGRCNGYAPKPFHATLVDYDWAETTVHNTPRFGETYG